MRRSPPKPVRIFNREYEFTCPCGYAIKKWGIQNIINAHKAHVQVCLKKP